jgi:glutamate synthase (ferredoxin)
VTNPAIDPLREACVVSLHTRLGPWPHMLDKNAPLPGISSESPFPFAGQVAALRAGSIRIKLKRSSAVRWSLPALFAPEQTLGSRRSTTCQRAIELVRDGARI